MHNFCIKTLLNKNERNKKGTIKKQILGSDIKFFVFVFCFFCCLDLFYILIVANEKELTYKVKVCELIHDLY